MTYSAPDGVLTVALAACHAPERLLQTVAGDSRVRVVVLRFESEGFPAGTAQAELDRCSGLLPLMPQPVIGVVQGFCSPAAAPVLQACDIAFASHDARFGNPSIDAVQAERDGLVTLTFPLSELDAETAALARELAAKDPLALRFTKETLGLVGTMGWDEVLAYNAAKAAELKSLQAGRPSARAVAVESFLSGKSKPGLGR